MKNSVHFTAMWDMKRAEVAVTFGKYLINTIQNICEIVRLLSSAN